MGREKRMSSRRNFFQYFENEESADHIEKFPIPENTSTENANIIDRWRESTRSSRKRSFQNLEDEGTSAAPDIFEEQNNVIGVQTVVKQVNVHEKGDNRTMLSFTEIERNLNHGSTSTDNENRTDVPFV